MTSNTCLSSATATGGTIPTQKYEHQIAEHPACFCCSIFTHTLSCFFADEKSGKNYQHPALVIPLSAIWVIDKPTK
jgi:hypothetical protein